MVVVLLGEPKPVTTYVVQKFTDDDHPNICILLNVFANEGLKYSDYTFYLIIIYDHDFVDNCKRYKYNVCLLSSSMYTVPITVYLFGSIVPTQVIL